jgi:hypothetical protein
MTTRSPSLTKKTMRHFYCHDALWSLFEEMATEFDCSVDYLLNEAMRLYARSKQRVPAPPPPPPPRPPRPPEPPRPTTPASGERTLVLHFNQQQIAISKEQFVIGRKRAGSDLVIKDGNVSRQHAAIVRRNGAYYIKDLGSTNGVDFRGMRVDNKRIDEGDVFRICDYELKFTYR